jgi:hypothetical protein
MTTHPLNYSPSRERNMKKYYGISKQCVACLKPMKEGETKMVHMNEDWLMVHKSISVNECKEKTGANSQGFFEIGNSCAKKHPKEFIFDVGEL